MWICFRAVYFLFGDISCVLEESVCYCCGTTHPVGTALVPGWWHCWVLCSLTDPRPTCSEIMKRNQEISNYNCWFLFLFWILSFSLQVFEVLSLEAYTFRTLFLLDELIHFSLQKIFIFILRCFSFLKHVSSSDRRGAPAPLPVIITWHTSSSFCFSVFLFVYI